MSYNRLLITKLVIVVVNVAATENAQDYLKPLIYYIVAGTVLRTLNHLAIRVLALNFLPILSRGG